MTVHHREPEGMIHRLLAWITSHARRYLVDERVTHARIRAKQALTALAHFVPYLPYSREQVMYAVAEIRGAAAELKALGELPIIGEQACVQAIRSAESRLAVSDALVQMGGRTWN